MSTAQSVFAQDTDPFSYNAYVVPSANATAMVKYGNLQPSLYTGAMAYSQQIYTYQDEDFTIPISLDYHFDGYRPSMHSGPYGMGWNLNCGGVITREVVGLPDEYNSNDVYGFFFLTRRNSQSAIDLRQALSSDAFPYFTESGPYYASHSSPYLPSVDVWQFLGDTPLLASTQISYVSLSNSLLPELFDPSSDIYHFHFDGIDGKFVLLPSGEILVFDSSVPPGELTISMDMNGGAAGNATISIQTGKGTVYQFGGDNSLIDYSFDASLAEVSDKFFSSLKLHSITSPNGRVVEYDYSEPSFPFGRSYIDVSYSPEVRLISASDSISSVYYIGHNPKRDARLMKVVSRIPQRILIDGNTIIIFNYLDRPNYEFGGDAFSAKFRSVRSASISTQRRLESVVIKSPQGTLIDSVRLGHVYSSSSTGHSPKMFLATITGNSGVFSFEYNHSSQNDCYPPIDCEETDHWGYWRNTQGSFFFQDSSDIHSQDSSLYNVINGHKEPVFLYTMYGALISIKYPSGGQSVIEYEQNRVNNRIDVNTANGMEYYLSDVDSMLVGGVRVCKVSNYSKEIGHFNDSICYSYGSSGILYRMPRYIMGIKAAHNYADLTYLGYYVYQGHLSMVTWCSAGITNHKEGDFLGYSSVTAHHADGSSIKYLFTDYNDYPDRYMPGDEGGAFPKFYTTRIDDGDANTVFAHCIMGVTADDEYKNQILTEVLLDDNSALRGRAKGHFLYSSTGELLTEKHLCYSESIRDTRTTIFNCYSHYYVSNVTRHQLYLDSVITTEYLSGGGALSDTTLYTYNNLGQQTVVEKRGFDGDIRRSRLRYEHEGDTTAPRANVSDVVTTRYASYGNNPLEYVTSLNHFDYDTDSARRHLPIKASSYGKPLPWAPAVSSGDTLWFSPLAPCDTLVRRLSYDGKQRPSVLSMPGNAYLSFVWDTSGRYVFSREENGPAMKSYYAWRDMVGLTQLKNPTGRSEWYGYDEKNRLSEVYRADSVLVREYDYHIYSEDTTLGPSSIKQTIWRTADKNNREIAYYDGLGYPIQTVRTSTQPSGGHIVTPIAYDALRRDDVRAYLPYQASQSTYDSTAFTKQKNHYRTRFNQDTLAYTEKEYGTSPAGRLLSVRQPGKAYADSSKKVVYEYRTNTAEDSILNLSVTVSAQPQLSVAAGYLPAGKLLLTKTTDEDGCTSEVFTNSAGKTVLSRQRTGGQRLDTYFVYDLRDSLVCVLQPEGAALIAQNVSYNILQPATVHSMATLPTALDNLLEKYAFLYAYDSWGRFRLKKKPGAAVEEFVVDDRGRVAFSRDGNLRDSSKWLLSEYDTYDALTRRSLTNLSVGLDTLWRAMTFQIDSSQILLRDTVRIWSFLLDNNPDAPRYVYSRMLWPAAGDTLLSADGDYLSVSEGRGIDDLGSYTLVGSSHYYTTGNSILLDPIWGWQIDKDWQAIFADALTGKTLLEEHLYNRGDNPTIPQNLAFQDVTGIVSQVDLGSSLNLEVWQRQLLLPPGRTVPNDTLHYVERSFWYDTIGRVVQTVEANALGGTSRTSAKYDYLGNVIASEEKHTIAGSNTSAVKRMTFNYDKQGRVASEGVTVNGNTATTGTMFDYDLLGRQTYAYWSTEEVEMVENLSYDIRGRLTAKEIYRILPYEPTGGGGGGGHGGDDEEEEEEEPDSIEELVFGQYLKYFNPTKQSSQRRWNGLISEIAHQHGESAAIITNGYFYDNAGRLTDNIRYDGTQQTYKFAERNLSYDRNGNILTLKRYGETTTAPQDDLAYTYNGNKLTQLNNSGPVTGSFSYTYDNNGNTLNDSRRGLSFTWNHLNLPASITSNPTGASGTVVDYTYLADGTKAITSSGNEGYAYLGTMTYKRSGNSWFLESVPFTGGRFIANASGGFEEYRYITDHLGSTRLIVKGYDYQPDERNDYYPFGMRIADSSLSTNAVNRWRFSGNEMQTLGGIGLIDFGARLYDDFRDQWPTQDALGEKYNHLSSYNYCANNPIFITDVDGRELWIVTRRNNYGKIIEKVKYSNGKVFQPNGQEYTGNNTFVKAVSSALKRIESIENTLVKQVFKEVVDGECKNYVVENSIGKNSVQSLDMSSAHKGERTGAYMDLDIKESQHFDDVDSTPETTVAHELRHVYDYNLGNYKGKLNGNKATGKDITEIKAVQFENIIRNALNLPIRTKYGGITIPQK